MQNIIKLIQSNTKIEKLLHNCPLYILQKLQIEHFPKKQFHLHQGQQYPNVYIIVSGEVQVYLTNDKGNQITLDIYKVGNFIGEHEAILKQPFSASLRSLTAVTLLKMHYLDYLQWLKTDQYISFLMIENLCQQMYTLTNKTGFYNLQSTQSQIISSILNQYEQNRHHYISKKMILTSVSSSPRNVYRILKKLIDRQLIDINQDHIKINNMQKLQQLQESEDFYS